MKNEMKSKTKKDLSHASGKPMIETCHLGVDNMMYHEDARDESSYIHEHLTTLRFIVDAFECKNVLEIGTGPGESLLAMAEDTNAHITTVDIEKCEQARDKLMFFGDYQDNVTFIQGKSDKLNLMGWFDLVFIDGGHEYKQVKKDIEQFHHWVKDGGFLVFHDMTNPAWPGVRKAVEEFLEKRGIEYKRYDWFNCNGLTVLRKDIIDEC